MTDRRNLNLEDAEVIFYTQLFSKKESDLFFNELIQQVEWKQEPIKIFGKSLLQPRLTAYFGDKYYTYSGATMKPLAWNKTLLQIKKKIELLTNTNFNEVLLNLYRDGQDYISWHSDDETDLAKDSIIGSLSLGETRRFLLRRRDNHQIKVELNLGHGDFLTMGGNTQKFLQHHIPKTNRLIKSRINLTFRVLK